MGLQTFFVKNVNASVSRNEEKQKLTMIQPSITHKQKESHSIAQVHY